MRFCTAAPDAPWIATRFVQTLPALQRQYPAPLEQADLRYPQGYAVKLRGTSTWADAASKPKPPPVRKPSAPTPP